MNQPDPVVVEVIRNRLASVLFAGSIALKRAAYSTVITEADDFSIAIFDTRCQLVAQLDQLPIFLGAMPEPLRAFVDKFSYDEMQPGDVYISNDPFTAGGTHKNDINIMVPVFVQGILRLLVMSKAHWSDIGGKSPGSWSPDATTSFEEGLSIPSIRLITAGQLNQDVLDLVLANTRLQTNNKGDLLAQISGCHVVIRGLDELFRKYDWELFSAVYNTILDRTEALVRRHISDIPDGVYRGFEQVDDDGVNSGPIPIDLDVIIEGSSLTVDFSRCPPQADGACGNSSYARTLSMVRTAVRSLTAINVPSNEGYFRPIRVVAPPGSVVHPVAPAPVTLGNHVARALREAIVSALSQAIPDRVVAGQFGGALTMIMSGADTARNREFIYVSPYAGGWGAGCRHDGTFPLMMLEGGRMRNVPCEVVEQLYPLRVESYALRPDSGGPGEWRGGLGIQTDLLVLAPELRLSVAMDRHRFPAPGLFGGENGAHSRLFVHDGNQDWREITKVAGYRLSRGSLISHRSGGGGGFGPPRARDPARVLADVVAGYVTPESARDRFGIVIVDGQVDAENSKSLREGQVEPSPRRRRPAGL